MRFCTLNDVRNPISSRCSASTMGRGTKTVMPAFECSADGANRPRLNVIAAAARRSVEEMNLSELSVHIGGVGGPVVRGIDQPRRGCCCNAGALPFRMADDPMAFLEAQRAKLAAMTQAANAAAGQRAAAEALGRRMAHLDSKFAEVMEAPIVTELTSAELEARSALHSSELAARRLPMQALPTQANSNMMAAEPNFHTAAFHHTPTPAESDLSTAVTAMQVGLCPSRLMSTGSLMLCTRCFDCPCACQAKI